MLLEPIMSVEVVVPEEYMGPVVGDINSRRGLVQRARALLIALRFENLCERIHAVGTLGPTGDRTFSGWDAYKGVPQS